MDGFSRLRKSMKILSYRPVGAQLSDDWPLSDRQSDVFCRRHHVAWDRYHMGVSENSVPLNPMVLLIIIPFLNGYFIGNIPYFQTNPYVSELCPANLYEIQIRRTTPTSKCSLKHGARHFQKIIFPNVTTNLGGKESSNPLLGRVNRSFVARLSRFKGTPRTRPAVH